MPTDLAPALIVLGRLLLGGHFLVAAIRNFGNIGLHMELMTARGVPQPRLVLFAGIILQAVAGAMVAFGIWPAPGAVGLIVFSIVAAALYHNFWDYGGEERIGHINACLTNAALIGGLLLVIAAS